MAKDQPVYGAFGNGIPFARAGNRPKSMLVFLSGPGNRIPGGSGIRGLAGRFLASAGDYTAHLDAW